jgi:nicotinamidase-related amidase
MRVSVRCEPKLPVPGKEVREEAAYFPQELAWSIPVTEAALVCIDCWNFQPTPETRERVNHCTENHIVPLLAACRRNGMLVIHAPAGDLATRHPNWVQLKPKPARPQWVWPPKEFVERTGPYAHYKRPQDPRIEVESKRLHKTLDFDPRVKPVGAEPVILDGEELHMLCAQRKIMHLFFIGFYTNICVIIRDYGVLAMRKRGYNVILVRDCTTGMEVAETLADLTCTIGTIKTIEQREASVTSDQLIDALDNTVSS